MRLIKLRKWTDYQHYKDGRRSPPWIKLHAKLLQSKTWIRCNDSDRVLAIGLMVLASQCNNEIEYDPEHIAEVLRLKSEPNFDRLVELEFIRIVDEAGDNVEPEPKPKPKAKAKPKPAKKKTAERFDEFWTLYPRKIKRKDALKVWTRDNLDEKANEILANVRLRVESDEQWIRDEGKFVPYPTTYLNGEQWTDEIKTSIKAGATPRRAPVGRDF